MSSNHIRYTREELIAILRAYNDKLGHTPAKKDVPGNIVGMCHSTFGKWCYALEAAGVKIPSESALVRRAHNKAKWKKKHREMVKRRARMKRAKQEAAANIEAPAAEEAAEIDS